MPMQGAVGKDEHDVGAAGAAIAPRFQLNAGKVRHEIRLPHVIAGPHRETKPSL
jgi:hypothetical protein